MIEYRFAQAQDMGEVIDFINMIFSMIRRPHDFSRLLPKAYDPQYGAPEMNAIAVESGRVCGVVAVYPYTMNLAGHTLRAGYVGSVSVHPRVRGQGVMKRLMQMQIQHAKENGLDMLLLGGLRQRYERYGFTNAGVTYTYSLLNANVRHAWPQVDAAAYSFRPMTQSDAQRLYPLYAGQLLNGLRTPEKFLASLVSFHGCPWTICKGESLCGYVVSTADHKRLTELVPEEDDCIPAVLKAWLAQQTEGPIAIEAAPHQQALHRTLVSVCEGWEMGQSSSILSLRPERVTEAYLTYKNRLEPLSHGEYRIAIGERGTLHICVGREISCRWTQDAPDFACTEAEAQQLFFSFNPFAVPHPAGLPRDWFPLPLHIAEPDTF